MRRIVRVLILGVVLLAVLGRCASASPVAPSDPFFENGEWTDYSTGYCTGVWQTGTVYDEDFFGNDGLRTLRYHLDTTYGGSRGPQHSSIEFTLDDYTTESLYWILDMAVTHSTAQDLSYNHQINAWNGSAWVDFVRVSYNTYGVVGSTTAYGGYVAIGTTAEGESPADGLRRSSAQLTPAGAFEWNDFAKYRMVLQWDQGSADPTTGILWQMATAGLFDSDEIEWAEPESAVWVPTDPADNQLKPENLGGFTGKLDVDSAAGFRWSFWTKPLITFNGRTCGPAENITYSASAEVDGYVTIQFVNNPRMNPLGLPLRTVNTLTFFGKNALTGEEQIASYTYYYGIIGEGEDAGELDPDVPVVPPDYDGPPLREHFPDGIYGTIAYQLARIEDWISKPFVWLGDILRQLVDAFQVVWAWVGEAASDLGEATAAVFGLLPEPMPGLLVLAVSLNLFFWVIKR